MGLHTVSGVDRRLAITGLMPRTPRLGGIASISGSNWVTSLRFAPVRIALTETPLASTRMWCLEPNRARSVGFGPDDESTAAREKSI